MPQLSFDSFAAALLPSPTSLLLRRWRAGGAGVGARVRGGAGGVDSPARLVPLLTAGSVVVAAAAQPSIAVASQVAVRAVSTGAWRISAMNAKMPPEA